MIVYCFNLLLTRYPSVGADQAPRTRTRQWALRRAEAIHPHRVQRDPFVRDTVAVLLRHSRRGSPAD